MHTLGTGTRVCICIPVGTEYPGTRASKIAISNFNCSNFVLADTNWVQFVPKMHTRVPVQACTGIMQGRYGIWILVQVPGTVCVLLLPHWISVGAYGYGYQGT